MNSTEELMSMLNAVEVRAAELQVPALVLIGMLTHVATSQSMSLNALIASRQQPTIAQQIMAGRVMPQ